MLGLRRHTLLTMVVAGLMAVSAIAYGADRQSGETSTPKTHDASSEETVAVLLDRVSAMGFEDYHPAYVIDAVNALQPLGKKGALARIDAYLKARGDRLIYPDGLFWVLRVLFEVPSEQGFPPLRIGKPSLPLPAEPQRLPRFPIAMVLDVPLLVVRGFALGGFPEQVESHVAYFRVHGVLRERPLTPPVSRNGVEEAFLRQWRSAYGDAYTAEVLETVRPQISRRGG